MTNTARIQILITTVIMDMIETVPNKSFIAMPSNTTPTNTVSESTKAIARSIALLLKNTSNIQFAYKDYNKQNNGHSTKEC